MFYCFYIPKGKKDKKGFSLIELMVAITIIVIFSSILLPYYNNIRRQYALLRSAYRLSQDLRMAQEMATSAKEFYSEVQRKDIVPVGYGIYLENDNDSYQLYADLDGNQEYDANDQTLETIKLEANVKIMSLSPANYLSVNFKGPDPLTRLKAVSGEASSGMIVLSLAGDASFYQRVIINQAGLIYVE